MDAGPSYDHLSTDPTTIAGLARPGSTPPIPVPPVVDDGAIVIIECGEPLVAVTSIGCVNGYRAVGWVGTDDVVRLRARVIEKLRAVEAALPGGFGLAIYDGWRSPVTVRALYEHYYGTDSTLEPGFLADPDDETVAPPHQTGGAVDLTLAWKGTPLSLGTAFDDFTPRAHLRALENEPGLARDLRRLLHHALGAEGFVPFDQEWWHYSWGDQAWAAATGAGHAIYGAVNP